VAGKHGFSGSRPPSAQPLMASPSVRRHIRLGPPANDNIRLGGLRFTGLRIAVALTAAILVLALLRGTSVL